MLRRVFMKWFGGASAAAAVTIGPKVVEAVQAKPKEERLDGRPLIINPKQKPRNVEGIGFSEDLLALLGFSLNPTRSEVLRIDEVVKSAGCVPVDAVLEVVFPAIPQQLALIFHYRHKSFRLVYGLDVLSVEAVDASKLKKFFVRS